MSVRGTIAALLVAVTGGALLSGCSGSDAEPPAVTSAEGPSAASEPSIGPPTQATADPSKGCGRTPPKQGIAAFDLKGTRRSFLLTLPSTYTNDEPAPLVLNFHGLGSNALEQNAYSRLTTSGPQEGFIIVTPETVPGRNGWKLPGMTDGEADIDFADALLDHIEKTMCVDRNREFAAGMSNGAGLSAALICGLKGRLAAVAPVSGVNLTFPCPDAEPTTIIAFHGTGDKIVPYHGGAPFGGQQGKIPAWMRPKQGKINLPGVEWVTAAWARNFKCRPAQDGIGGQEVRLRRYAGCKKGAIVELHTVREGGHTWPGSIQVKGLGKTTALIDATALVLEAFATHPATR